MLACFLCVYPKLLTLDAVISLNTFLCFDAQLARDEAGDRPGRLAKVTRLPTKVSQPAYLHRDSQPIVRTSALPNQTQIAVAQSEASRQFQLVYFAGKRCP